MQRTSSRDIQLLLTSLLTLLLFSTMARASDIELLGGTTDCGGGPTSGGSYTLVSIVGRADAGTMTGGSFTLDGGFMAADVGPPPPCPSDIDRDGTVGFGDLLALLYGWGACDGCPEDLDGNGAVGFEDLLDVLYDWGPCP